MEESKDEVHQERMNDHTTTQKTKDKRERGRNQKNERNNEGKEER